ncbi:hypothetical protein GCM10020000_14820 [Streptomyces olivoverticillatus]
MKWIRALSVALAVTAAGAAPAQAAQRPVPGVAWQAKATGSDARFRGLAAVSRSTAWVAGTKGTVLLTRDGGGHWRDVSPPGAGALEFRDVEAFDARHAVVLAIGEGEASRIFRTADGGAHWTESFRNTDPRAFYDCLAFFDHRHGIALGDPVDGRFRVLATADGGRTWRLLPPAGMPAAQPGEAAFAASGQCVVTSGTRDAWIATGGAAASRVLHSADRGRTWTAAATPVPAGDPARGVFALAFRGGPRAGRRRRLPRRTALGARRRRQRRRREELARGRRAARRLPFGRGLAAARPRHGRGRRPHRQRDHHGWRPHLARLRHRLLRHGRLRTGRRLLGGGGEGAGRPSRRGAAAARVRTVAPGGTAPGAGRSSSPRTP